MKKTLWALGLLVLISACKGIMSPIFKESYIQGKYVPGIDLDAISVLRVEPSGILSASSTLITIYGNGFTPGSSITLSSANTEICTNPTYINSSTFTCTPPTSTGIFSADVRVTSPNGVSGVLRNGLNYLGDPLLWLDADDSTKLSITPVGPNLRVDQWRDKGSSGDHAIVATGANSPVLARLGFNDRGAIRFLRGGTECLEINPNGALATALSSDYTLLVVAKVLIFPLVGAGTETPMALMMRPGLHQLLHIDYTGEPRFTMWNTLSADFNHIGLPGDIAIEEGHLLTASLNAGTGAMEGGLDGNAFAGGAPTFTGTAENNTSATPYRIGCADPSYVGYRWYFTGQIAEIFFLPTHIPLGSNEMRVFQNYLSTKWGI